ncbi:MAG: GNAT family N-acetyltransferase [candidate division Zixibacteria bacterium]|nr:GNAT family N-acetyltransferase [candidate division Zixibacteria bacterium]
MSEIRTLTALDYEKIINLWAEAGLPYKPQGRDSKEMLTKEMLLPQTVFLGIDDGSDKMIAMGIANFDGRRGWINRVAVDPDWRGQNLAGQIIDACEKFLYKQGAVVICALIEDINYPSISTFQKNGYTCEQTIKYFTKRNSQDA